MPWTETIVRVVHQDLRVFMGAFAHHESDDQLTVRSDRRMVPHIARLRHLGRLAALLFFSRSSIVRRTPRPSASGRARAVHETAGHADRPPAPNGRQFLSRLARAGPWPGRYSLNPDG